jgi:MoaA/NifB/PqqE/SkfB family radical SAM enzyme
MDTFRKIVIGLSLFKADALNSRVPLTASLHITNRCNFRCDYCDIHSRPKKEMTTQEIKDMIDQLSRIGLNKLGISGGEPLLREDIGEIVDHARSRGIHVSITSNGSLIKERAGHLKNLGLLLISYDGPCTSMRKGEKDTLGNIRHAVDAGLEVWSITVLTKQSLECLDLLFEESRLYGFSMLFQPLNLDYSLNKPGKGSETSISRQQLSDAVERIIQAKKDGFPVANSYSYLRLLKSGFVNTSAHCMAGRRYINIDADGKVYPCGVLFDSMEVRNGLEVGFRKAFLSIPKRFGCPGCMFPCYLENDLIMKMRPEALANVMRYQ